MAARAEDPENELAERAREMLAGRGVAGDAGSRRRARSGRRAVSTETAWLLGMLREARRAGRLGRR